MEAKRLPGEPKVAGQIRRPSIT
jgi:hypothetical protein